MKLNEEPFNKIKSGSKIYELRLYDEKRRRLKLGDFIEFTKRGSEEKCIVQVIDIKVFRSFSDLYAALPLIQCGYSALELKNASPADMNKYYSEADQLRYGVVAIEIKLI